MNKQTISGYKFVRLTALPTLREELRGICLRLNILGTILLGEEGVNIMLAAKPAEIELFKTELKTYPQFSDIEFKDSFIDELPFNLLKIKVKPEVVTMGVEGIDPTKANSSYLSPNELKQWYDEKRDFVIIDTRNDYEVELGAFETAVDLKIKNFREFPDAVKQLDESLKDKDVVIFCTGGIRCEKAGPYMQSQGFKNVHQLHGGIIKYFEECGGEHYRGDCFVFDDRLVINNNLEKVKQTRHTMA